MKPETISTIKALLAAEVASHKNRMMDCINNGFDAFLKDRIEKYREAYNAQDDFFEWLEQQEDTDG